MPTQAPQTNEQPKVTAQANAAALPAFRLGSGKAREALSAGFVLLACILWFYSLARLGAPTDALPWYITIGIIAAVCARQVARRPSPELTFDWSPKRTREPLTLLESWTIAYCAASIGLYLWIVVQPAAPKLEARKLVQFVDIQLTSLADAANRQSPLPGTVEAQQLHKRDADKVTQQGSLTSTKVAQVARREVRKTDSGEQKASGTTSRVARNQSRDAQDVDEKQIPHAPQPRTLAAQKQTVTVAAPHIRNNDGAPVPLKPLDNQPLAVKPVTQGSQTAQKQTPRNRAASQQPLIEEVQPSEMVEFIENDGVRDATTVYEGGGSSAGGAGAPNDLAAYIKALHKRIKDAWAPPRGQSRKAQVLFRIRQDGTLAFIKLIRSSGDSDTDAAAIKTVQKAVIGKPLPSDYSLPYLDVQYNFLYTADELKEVSTSK